MMILLYASCKSDLPALREHNFSDYPKWFLDDDNIICLKFWYPCDYRKVSEKTWKAHGFNTGEQIINFLCSYKGKTAPPWLIQDIQKRAKQARELRERYLKDWARMKETFDGNVLKMGCVEFRTDLDFTVRLSLLSGGYKQQIEYVKNNSQDIIDYVCTEIQKRQTVMNKIGSLNFYYVSRITVTRQSEVELMFSLKPKLEQLQ